ncbi:MAG: LPS export ABC transporter periplasmic protein LptC [Gemmatimonadota bacterium]|nr:LPS export ABC transporter periplasmic protein LptC [Gemmatimonadota bacterium]
MDQTRRRSALLRRFLLPAALIAAGACQVDVNTPGTASSEMEGLESPIVFGMVAYMTATGVREGRIQADTAFTYADSSKIDLRGMTAVFFDENGRDRATVTGREGEWDQESDRMLSKGDVVLLVHTDGSKIESAEINYDPSIDRVWSDSATVRTLADGSVTRGSSFESDIAFENVDVRNPRGALQVF